MKLFVRRSSKNSIIYRKQNTFIHLIKHLNEVNDLYDFYTKACATGKEKRRRWWTTNPLTNDDEPPTNCSDLSLLGYTLNGYYLVKPVVMTCHERAWRARSVWSWLGSRIHVLTQPVPHSSYYMAQSYWNEPKCRELVFSSEVSVFVTSFYQLFQSNSIVIEQRWSSLRHFLSQTCCTPRSKLLPPGGGSYTQSKCHANFATS